MTVPVPSDVLHYLFGVRDALADLEPAERDELLEELQSHLQELRAEDPEVDLVQRLGRPAAYAGELRAAAGLPVRPRVLSARASWRDLLARLRTLPGGPAFLEFLPSLRPAWWVLRALVLSQLLVAASVGRFHPASLILSAVFVVASVQLGRRWQAATLRKPAQLGLLAANAVAGVAAFLLYAQAPFDHPSTSYVEVGSCCGALVDSAGNPVTNLFAYDAEGRLIERVQLFDQEGQPLVTSLNEGGAPAMLGNVFPQKVFTGEYDEGGSPQLVEPTSPVTAVPRLPLDPSASASPRALPTPSPGPATTRAPRATPATTVVPTPRAG